MRNKTLLDFYKDYTGDKFPFFSIRWYFFYLCIAEIPGFILIFILDNERAGVGKTIYWIFAIASIILIVERALKKSTDSSLILVIYCFIISPLFALHLYTELIYQYTWFDHMNSFPEYLMAFIYLLALPVFSNISGVLITLFIAILSSYIFQNRYKRETAQSKTASRTKKGTNPKYKEDNSRSEGNSNSTKQTNENQGNHSRNKRESNSTKQANENQENYSRNERESNSTKQANEKATSKFEKILGFNPDQLSKEEIKNKLFEEQKKWINRTNAPSLDKRQEAEKMLQLLTEIEKELIN